MRTRKNEFYITNLISEKRLNSKRK